MIDDRGNGDKGMEKSVQFWDKGIERQRVAEMRGFNIQKTGTAGIDELPTRGRFT